ALNTGLPILNRTAHAYRVHYYENDTGPGFDATVFSPTVDLKIKNDTQAAILIQTSVDEVNRLVYFKLYGKKDGRKVEVSKAEVWDVSPPPEPSYEDDPTLQRGITKQIDFGAWGAKARFSYKVTYPTNEVKDEIFYSVYRPWKAIFMVGTKDS
ncbi:MAG: VanW family protein, partial [Microgenomates group bacterium]